MKTLHKALEVSDGMWNFAPVKPVVGLDLGSRGSKGVLIIGDEISTVFTPTGLFMQETADELVEKLLDKTGLERADLGHIVSTGYGRISLSFDDVPFEVVTEISCHAMGAHSLHPNTRTVIDIGGQDSKAIKVDTRNGKVIEFVMNDKCAAGTGRFLEVMARILDCSIEGLSNLSENVTEEIIISNTCTVFAESEVISQLAAGAKRENVARGAHKAVAKRVAGLGSRIGLTPDVVMTGGVALNKDVVAVLEKEIGQKITVVENPQIIGAMGAALYALEMASKLR